MKESTKIRIRQDAGQKEVILEASELKNSLADVLDAHGFPLNTRCGQRGLCRGCIVNIDAGAVRERDSGECATGSLKACLYGVNAGDTLDIEIPGRSLVSHRPEVAVDFEIKVPFAQDPLYPGAREKGGYGLAIDIGTTTVVVALVDLKEGTIVSRRSSFNGQMKLGDNVLTRIQLCCDDKEMVKKLQRAIVDDTLSPLTDELCQMEGIDPAEIKVISAAGNTTMLHLLADVDPSSMGIAPFTPVFIDTQVKTVGDFDFSWKGLDETPFYLLPSLGAYVGADLSAGVFATGMHYDDRPVLLVDVGTNGEIILKHGDHLYGCATAAGPAFEGSGLTSGMRAVEGVISEIVIEKDPFRFRCSKIGNNDDSATIGICGTGFVDFLAEGRRSGLLMTSGRFDPEFIEKIPASFMGETEYAQAIKLEPDCEGDPILVSEADVALLIQAKAAISAGILTLLDKCGLKPADVSKLYLAGGFGLFLNRKNAIKCGLFPGFSEEQIEVVGNTSLAGAYISLVDKNAIDEMERIKDEIEIVELNLDPGFEDHFLDSLSLD